MGRKGRGESEVKESKPSRAEVPTSEESGTGEHTVQQTASHYAIADPATGGRLLFHWVRANFKRRE